MRVKSPFILIFSMMMVMFSLLAEEEMLNKVIVRVGNEVILENDLRIFYSLFLDPGKKPYYNEKSRQVILDEMIRFKAAKQSLESHYFRYDEKHLRNYSEQMLQTFKQSFPSRLEFLLFIKILKVQEDSLPDLFLEYFSTLQKMQYYFESKLREEKKVETIHDEFMVYRVTAPAE